VYHGPVPELRHNLEKFKQINGSVILPGIIRHLSFGIGLQLCNLRNARNTNF